jgi:predicted Fe-S protein YdhL (DUF1289 family)
MAPFDEICKGCGRNIEEIRDWETYPDIQKKIINVKNWLQGYDIRQKIKEVKMSEYSKKDDIKGRMTTVLALIEMIGKDMLDEYGKDPSIKESYQALFNSRESILKSKENFPQD